MDQERIIYILDYLSRYTDEKIQEHQADPVSTTDMKVQSADV